MEHARSTKVEGYFYGGFTPSFPPSNWIFLQHALHPTYIHPSHPHTNTHTHTYTHNLFSVGVYLFVLLFFLLKIFIHFYLFHSWKIVRIYLSPLLEKNILHKCLKQKRMLERPYFHFKFPKRLQLLGGFAPQTPP